MMNATERSLCGGQPVGFCGVIMRRPLILPALGEFGVTYWGVMVGPWLALGVGQLGLARVKRLRIAWGELVLAQIPPIQPTRRRPQNLQARSKTMTSWPLIYIKSVVS
jgi:hypothetical protein